MVQMLVAVMLEWDIHAREKKQQPEGLFARRLKPKHAQMAGGLQLFRPQGAVGAALLVFLPSLLRPLYPCLPHWHLRVPPGILEKN